MDKNFRRWTVGACFATAFGIYSLWWSGRTGALNDTCNLLGVQETAYCGENNTAHASWLLITLVTFIYMGIYIARVRRLLKAIPPQSPAKAGNDNQRGSEHHTLQL